MELKEEEKKGREELGRLGCKDDGGGGGGGVRVVVEGRWGADCIIFAICCVFTLC